MSEQQPVSGWAIGWTYFAGVMMLMLGVFQVFAGLSAIAEDEIYVATQDWVFQLDLTTWGWIHLILGIVVVASGFGVMLGNVLARTVGVVLAVLTAAAGFAYLPWYPGWAIVIIVVSVAVIWALTVHGRDVIEA